MIIRDRRRPFRRTYSSKSESSTLIGPDIKESAHIFEEQLVRRWKMRAKTEWFSGFGIWMALAVVLPILGTGTAKAQVVSPLQPGHYVPGIINVRDMATPAPGLFVVWYNWSASSDTFIDRNGNELTSLNLSNINPSFPNVDVDLDLNGFTTVPSVLWVPRSTILGGARYFAAVAPNYLTADYEVGLIPGATGADPVARTEEGSLSGFSDLVVAPLGLSWAFGEFDNVTATDEELAAIGLPPSRRFNFTTTYSFAAPTGRYETGASDNLGLGFWTHQFQGFAYYYPFEHQATAIMAGLTYELNSSIKDVDVTPGNHLSLEWGLSQYLTPWLELSILGGHNWQVSDDSGADVFWDPTVHDRKSTLMFGAGFWPWQGRLYVSARYGFDFAMRQRFDNTNLMVNVIFITNLLDGR
jgi:hypothetical protein